MNYELKTFKISSSNIDYIADITTFVCKIMGENVDGKAMDIYFAKEDGYVFLENEKKKDKDGNRKHHIQFVISCLDYGLKGKFNTVKSNNKRKIKKMIIKYLIKGKDKADIGDGYNDCFNNFDGSIGYGYKVYKTNNGAGVLYLGYTHIYYGK